MRILCTGGAGFIGSHVVEKLISLGHTVWVIDNMSSGRNEFPELFYKTGEFWEMDIRRSQIRHAFVLFRPDAVIHLAAQAAISTSIADPMLDMDVNGLGTLRIIQNCIEFGVKRIVFSSTSAVYLEKQLALIGSISEDWPAGPNTPYGISKLAAEGYINLMFPSSVILRFGNVYGPRQIPIGKNQVIARMIRHLQFGDDFQIFGNGTQTRDFVYVEDVADAVIASLEGNPGTYNIATNMDASVNIIGDAIALECGKLGYLWEHTKDDDPRRSVRLDTSRAKEGLGWDFRTNLADGLHKTVSWWKENGKK